jgi:hypothetical protein
MFLHGGKANRPGTKTVFSIPGPSLSAVAANNSFQEQFRQDASSSSGSSSSGSPVKKRSRPPPVLFRLSTEDEERLMRERESEGTSGTRQQEDDAVMMDATVSPTTTSKSNNMLFPLSLSKKKGMEVKVATSNAIARLYTYASGRQIAASNSEVPGGRASAKHSTGGDVGVGS